MSKLTTDIDSNKKAVIFNYPLISDCKGIVVRNSKYFLCYFYANSNALTTEIECLNK